MPHRAPKLWWDVHRVASSSLLALVLLLGACQVGRKADNDQALQMAIWLDSVPELKSLNVSNAEIAQLSSAHQAGLSDPSAVALIRHARSRQKPFANGQAVADLLSAGFSEPSVLQLDQMNQLGEFAGQAQALRLAGFSDKLVLAVAKRHSEGLAVMSGEKLAELKNAGTSEATILEMVQNGTTDQTASEYIAQRERAAGGHSFVYQGRHKKS